VTAIATTALDRADAATPPAATATPAPQRGAEPVRYQVGRGDTAFSIARKFNIPVSSLAAWSQAHQRHLPPFQSPHRMMHKWCAR